MQQRRFLGMHRMLDFFKTQSTYYLHTYFKIIVFVCANRYVNKLHFFFKKLSLTSHKMNQSGTIYKEAYKAPPPQERIHICTVCVRERE